jgi:putative transposase
MWSVSCRERNEKEGSFIMGMNDINSLSCSKWNCKYHIVFAPKYRRMFFAGRKKEPLAY